MTKDELLSLLDDREVRAKVLEVVEDLMRDDPDVRAAILALAEEEQRRCRKEIAR